MMQFDIRPIALAGMAVLVLAGPSVAQVQEQVFMPWQEPAPKEQVKTSKPALKEFLPWLQGNSAVKTAAAQPSDSSWDTQIDVPIAPEEPKVATPEMAQPERLETGAISPSGLVLKDKPEQAVRVAAEAAQETVDAPAEKAEKKAAEKSGAGGQTIALPGDKPAVKKRPIAERTVAQSLANSEDYALDTPAAQQTQATTAANARTDEDYSAPIPEPLPDSKISTDKETLDRVQATKRSLVSNEKIEPKPRLPLRLPPDANVAEQYCFNIADAAKDARYAWQKKTLADVEEDLKKRIAKLEERTAEYKKWLARRDEFIKTAKETVVAIYAGMKPGVAATQLALMHEESAAAVLTKLKTRNASAILNEMDPAKAARLTMIITGAAKLQRERARAKREAKRQREAQAAGGQL